MLNRDEALRDLTEKGPWTRCVPITNKTDWNQHDRKEEKQRETMPLVPIPEIGL